mgnify:CR=1 FL=1
MPNSINSAIRVAIEILVISVFAATLQNFLVRPPTDGVNIPMWGLKWMVANVIFGFAFFAITFLPLMVVGMLISRTSIKIGFYKVYKVSMIGGILGVLILTYGGWYANRHLPTSRPSAGSYR